MNNEDKIRQLIVQKTTEKIGLPFWKGTVGDYYGAYTCVDLGFEVFLEAGVIDKKVTAMELYKQAIIDIALGSSQPFSTGVERFFARKDEKDKKPGDFIMLIFNRMDDIHFAIYVGDDKYIDNTPQRNRVDYVTYDELMAKPDLQRYFWYDSLSYYSVQNLRLKK